jgi:murein DD-endopeptidase MepM/ murein hydrolase activator NlpD
VITLPSSFRPTHETDGLPGFPAVDLFGSPRELVRASFWGRVTRISGRAPSAGGRPHGPYGRSVYVRNAVTGAERYLTHLDELAVQVGDVVTPRTIIGTLCDSAVSGLPGTTHVHYGLKR